MLSYFVQFSFRSCHLKYVPSYPWQGTRKTKNVLMCFKANFRGMVSPTIESALEAGGCSMVANSKAPAHDTVAMK